MQNIIKTEQNLPVELVAVAKGYIEQSTSSATLKAYTALNDWLNAAQIFDGHLFCPITKAGMMQPTALTCRSIANIIKKYAALAGLSRTD